MVMTQDKDIYFKKAWAGQCPELLPIKDNEIWIEYDNVSREEGLRLTKKTCENLTLARISWKMYDHNGKSPHILVEIEGLDKLTPSRRSSYKEKFILKYCADKEKVDLSLTAKKKLIAQPNYEHYKKKLEGRPYSVKVLIDWEDYGTNKNDKEILKEVTKPQVIIHKTYRNDGLNISEIAVTIPGLKQKGNKLVGSHPCHGSSTGMNFEIDLIKNKWFCFRHNVGGGPVSLLAMLKGIVECKNE